MAQENEILMKETSRAETVARLSKVYAEGNSRTGEETRQNQKERAITEAQSWIAKFKAGLTIVERAEAIEEISLRRAVKQTCRVTHYTFPDGSELVVRRGERDRITLDLPQGLTEEEVRATGLIKESDDASGRWVHLGPHECKGGIAKAFPQGDGEPSDRWWVRLASFGSANVGETVWADDFELRDGKYYPKAKGANAVTATPSIPLEDASLAHGKEDAEKTDSLATPRQEGAAKGFPPDCPECADAKQEEEDYFPARRPPRWAESLPPGATQEEKRRAQLQWQIKCLQWLLDGEGEKPEGIDDWCEECGCPQYYCHRFAPPFNALAESGSLTGLDDLNEGDIPAAVPATKAAEFRKQVRATDLGENGDALLTMRDGSVVRVHDLRRDGVALRPKDTPVTVYAYECWDRVPEEALPQAFYGSSPLGQADCRCRKKA